MGLSSVLIDREVRKVPKTKTDELRDQDTRQAGASCVEAPLVVSVCYVIRNGALPTAWLKPWGQAVSVEGVASS